MRQRFPSVWLLDERAERRRRERLARQFVHVQPRRAGVAGAHCDERRDAAADCRGACVTQTACAGRGEIAKASPAEIDRCLLVLGALARSMHRTTSVMDDAELLEESRLLPMSELVRLCSLLANVLCRLYWLDIRCAARSALSQLLGGLVDRDARRRFCAPDTWLVAALRCGAAGRAHARQSRPRRRRRRRRWTFTRAMRGAHSSAATTTSTSTTASLAATRSAPTMCVRCDWCCATRRFASRLSSACA
jgi:hypothetical protein